MAATLGVSGITRSAGFTLVELAMVLFIISLVVGGLLVPMATQLEARQRNDTQEKLEEIREALIGYALINAKLPCPAQEEVPTSPNFGVEDPTNCNVPPAEGYLPWKTLGMAEYDSWGVAQTSGGDMTGYWRYVVDTEFACPDDDCVTGQVSISGGTTDGLSVIDSSGNSLTSSSQSPVAIVYSAGAKDLGDEDGDGNEASGKADGENDDSPADAIYQGGNATTGFDDITIWLSRPLLLSRMVSAGTLP